jgi:penicillin amidase
MLSLPLLFGRPIRRRSLAERLAALPLRGAPLAQPVTISWNDHQVPWISARTDRDCAVALGLVHAHLRIGQMEVLRRIEQGRTAEMLGPAATAVDPALRTLDWRDRRSGNPSHDAAGNAHWVTVSLTASTTISRVS